NNSEFGYASPWPDGAYCNGNNKSVGFYPGPDPGAPEWQELFDRNTGQKYWHNSITGKPTWIDPKVATKEQPPPPPSQPPGGWRSSPGTPYDEMPKLLFPL
ncbi:unnamed protein product, partial [Laminaria digitata]